MTSPVSHLPSPGIAVIGGTGMNQWPGFALDERIQADTPYGAPSAPLLRGRFALAPVIFLPRHGEGHRMPPHAINYRANLWALHAAGVRTVIAVAAVGAIADAFAPGCIALPEDLLDDTWGRAHTFSDGASGAALQHVEFTQPYHPQLRAALAQAAAQAGIELVHAPVMAVTQGPRLETAAEVRRLQRDGADMIGMTSMPEAALAAELGLQYATIAVSVNWAAGIKGVGDIHAEIEQSIAIGMQRVRDILAAALPVLQASALHA